MCWWYGTYTKKTLALNCFNHSSVILSTMTHCTSEQRRLAAVFVEKATGKLERQKPKLDWPADLLCKHTSIFPAKMRGKMGAEMNGSRDCLS